jgi:hypothetical protein
LPVIKYLQGDAKGIQEKVCMRVIRISGNVRHDLQFINDL